MKQYVKPIKCGDHTHETWDAYALCSNTPMSELFPDFKESMGEKLDRLGACGMGYPALGMPCVRPAGHDNPVSICFAIVKNTNGDVAGIWMTQDSKEWVTDQSQWPKDLVISSPIFEQKLEEVATDRRGLVAHSRSQS